MTAQFARPPQRGRPGMGQAHEPHAALLIDFDNVTMGIRSDLTKELKNLLNSDIIKGKVAVQRAYADWRRYPQYIVPLAESSVDLIFAPAYGSAKKNATDIRLAIDAIELVFTRPEIGTIILLSGDSDFSSMVLKLKEYGKYVIGVGIRESASDLLVQNCDEYYSYSALTGLTRAGDEAPAVSEDPWELVELALRQMRENDDVMRSDRLKQVLLELDPSFDEKGLGFQKFNKFLQEAASRGLLSLRKQDNGQFEIGPPDAAAVAESQADARGEPRRGRGRRGRGRRDETRRETREEGRERAETRHDLLPPAAPLAATAQPSAAPEPGITAAPTAERTKPQPPQARSPAAGPEAPRPEDAPRLEIESTRPAAEPPRAKPDATRALAEPAARAEPTARTGTPARTGAPARTEAPAGIRAARPDREPSSSKPAATEPRADPESAKRLDRTRRLELAEPAAEIVPEAVVEDATAGPTASGKEAKPAAPADLAASYELLRRAAADLVKKSGQAARDSDVKRRMLELHAGWDESTLGFSKFSRFLRQAHDAEVVTLRKGENGVYDVLAGNGETAQEPAGERGRDRGRGRTGRARDRDRGAVADGTRAPAAAGAADAQPAAAASIQPAGRPAPPSREAEPTGTVPTEPPVSAAAPPPAALPQPPSQPAPARTAQVPPPGQKAAAPAALLFRRGSRGRGAPTGPPPLLEGQTAAVRKPGPATTVPAERQVAGRVEAEPATAAGRLSEPAGVAAGLEVEAAAARPALERAEVAATAAPERAEAEGPPESIAVELGLPQSAGEVATYIAANYRGVGPKSVQTLIDEFGAVRVFDALEKLPDRVRELVGASRGDRLLAAWQEDVRRRRRGETAASPAARKPAKRAAKGGASAASKRGAKKGGAESSATAAARAPAQKRSARPGQKSKRARGGRGSQRGKPPAQ